jgi:hypothetical protein
MIRKNAPKSFVRGHRGVLLGSDPRPDAVPAARVADGPSARAAVEAVRSCGGGVALRRQPREPCASTIAAAAAGAPNARPAAAQPRVPTDPARRLPRRLTRRPHPGGPRACGSAQRACSTHQAGRETSRCRKCGRGVRPRVACDSIYAPLAHEQTGAISSSNGRSKQRRMRWEAWAGRERPGCRHQLDRRGRARSPRIANGARRAGRNSSSHPPATATACFNRRSGLCGLRPSPRRRRHRSDRRAPARVTSPSPAGSGEA